MDKVDKLLNKLLEEHPSEQIIGALDEMMKMKPEELDTLGKKSQSIDKYKDETTNH